MPIYWLVYTSRLNQEMNFAIVKDIMAKSIRNNEANNITGMLVYRKGVFFQALEGPPSNLNTLYRKLLGDQRHTDVSLLYYNRANYRIFENWSMKSLDMDMLPEDLAKMITTKYRLTPTTPVFPVEPELVKAFLFDMRYLAYLDD